ncbi:MAG: hypothetical protein WAN36_06880 [Calditrichia bacterium]
MYMVREVFYAKPGKAKELVNKFKQVAPHFEQMGMQNLKVMTDVAAKYWTVVMESEVEDIGDFIKELRGATSQPEISKIMEGYMDLVKSGKREIFIIE